MSAPQSLILITVDCLRADHVGFLGYDRPTTPFLDSLARESVVFRNAIAAGVPTYYSFPAIMASRYPLALGRDVVGLAPGEPSLASTLREAGYATAAFVAGNPYLTRRFGYTADFEQFEDFLQEAAEPEAAPTPSRQLHTRVNSALARFSHKAGPLSRVYDEFYYRYCLRLAKRSQRSLDQLRRYPAADVLVDHACRWLERGEGGPFFLWLHFMDPHAPYYPPAKALDLIGRRDISAMQALELNSYWNRGDLKPHQLKKRRGGIISLYDAGIRWVDEQVRRLVATLTELGFGDRCTLALTADHGEEFLDHAGKFHSPANVHEDLVRVPLLIRTGAQRKGGEVNAPFSLLHLAPTLLDALGLAAPGTFRGRSGWGGGRNTAVREDATITECVTTCVNALRREERLGPRVLAVRNARYKLIFDFHSGESRLFDLESDPGELRPLSAAGADISSQRRELLQQARRHLRNSRSSCDQELRFAARLQDLGQLNGD